MFEEHFEERNVLGLSLAAAREQAERELLGEPAAYPGYSFGLSTGSTGAPGVFLTSASERHAWLGAVLGKFLPWKMLLGAEVALVLKHNNRLYQEACKSRLQLHYFDAAQPVDRWVEGLVALKPQVLIGPPSILERIAVSAAFGRRPFRPGLLLAGGEPLFPQDRTLLESRFGCPPRVIYQAKEGFLAAECAHGSIHLNEDLVRFERIELGRGRFVPVITDATRVSQTYRRFRLDDIALAGDPSRCPCGRPFQRLAAVEGRAQDVLLLDGKPTFPLEINALLAPHLNGRDYQVWQTAPDRLTLGVEGGAIPQAAIDASEISLPGYAPAEFIPAVPGEKRRRIRRTFDLRNDWLQAFQATPRHRG